MTEPVKGVDYNLSLFTLILLVDVDTVVTFGIALLFADVDNVQ